jgi:hypothetical protein
MPSNSIREIIPRGRPSSAIVLAALVALLTLAWLASSAQPATAKGVFFDPNSPAGKEYALPLDQARDEATGGGGSDRAAGVAAPLFGAGITRHDSKSGQAPGPSGEGTGRRASGDGKHGGQGGSAAGPVAVARISEAGGGYPMSSGAALVAAIVLLGGALGLALRGLQRLNSR